MKEISAGLREIIINYAAIWVMAILLAVPGYLAQPLVGTTFSFFEILCGCAFIDFFTVQVTDNIAYAIKKSRK